MRLPLGKLLWTCLAIVCAVPAFPGDAAGQGTSGPVVSDSKVGYIENAIPGSLFRLRFDAAYNNRRPSRAEFFYAKTGPQGPGLPFPERSVDYQDLSAYGEFLVAPELSAFLDVPTRFLDPDVNANTAGLADVNAGFKYAFWQNDANVLTFMFRTFAPTGDASRGLGTRHVSLEPGLLFYHALNEQTRIEGELRYWVPAGGTDFAGDVVRYGLGIQYDVFENNRLRVTPVAEFVGWTVLSGKESVVFPSGLVSIQDAAGDSILNAKLGVRVRLSEHLDLYGGWGRPLTGDRWYENVARFEARWLF